jgi:hypothetical protein
MGWWTVGPMPNSGILPLVHRPVGPAKARMTKPMNWNVAMSRGVDVVHHLDDTSKYLQVCNFSNFIQILLNCILNDFLQKGYTPYGMPSPPPSFPRPTTLGDPSTPQVDNMQVSETTIYFVFKPKSWLLNMHDLILFVLQAAHSSQAPRPQWKGGSPAPGVAPTWSPQPPVEF